MQGFVKLDVLLELVAGCGVGEKAKGATTMTI
jgi:hypothetical protein